MGPATSSRTSPVDQRTNWPRTAALLLLAALGLFLWLPPLVRAMVGEAVEPSQPAANAAEPRETSEPSRRADDGPTRLSFRVSQVAAWSVAGDAPDDMVLSSTILGKTRRAAVINGRLHCEGSQVVARGELYRLTAVFENRVQLRPVRPEAGEPGPTIELTLRFEPNDRVSPMDFPRTAER